MGSVDGSGGPSSVRGTSRLVTQISLRPTIEAKVVPTLTATSISVSKQRAYDFFSGRFGAFAPRQRSADVTSIPKNRRGHGNFRSTVRASFVSGKLFRLMTVTLGWKEYLDLPDLGIQRLKTKIDTGARTSSLHVSSHRVLQQHDDGTAELEIRVPLTRTGTPEVTARVRQLDRIKVTDSGGHPEIRPVIETAVRLGPVTKSIRLTLTDRTGMLFRMLLGRKALESDFLVDVSKKYLLDGEPS